MGVRDWHVQHAKSLQDGLSFQTLDFQFYYSHVPVMLGLYYAFFFQYLQVAVDLVVRAVDYADEVCHVRFSDLREG